MSTNTITPTEFLYNSYSPVSDELELVSSVVWAESHNFLFGTDVLANYPAFRS
jgi:hypothetical protein